jgi:ATP-dependent DNA helicase RecQ
VLLAGEAAHLFAPFGARGLNSAIADALVAAGAIRRALDDPGAEPCGRCTVCTGSADPVTLDPELVDRAVRFLRGVDVVLEPRKQWARGLPAPTGNLKPAQRAEVGRALSREGDAGWWPAVDAVLTSGEINDELVRGIAATLKRWPWEQRPTWVTWIPSRHHDPVLQAVASELGRLGKLPVVPALHWTRDRPEQHTQQNGAPRLGNVWGALEVDPGPDARAALATGPVLVLDDALDSGWTMTVAAERLRHAGAPAVLPFVLVKR